MPTWGTTRVAHVPIGCFSDFYHSAFYNMIDADPAVCSKKLRAAKHIKSFAAHLFYSTFASSASSSSA